MAKLFVFPAWQGNPYLNMLYLAARARGYDMVGTGQPDELVRLAEMAAAGDVLHIHWTSPICQDADSYDIAAARLAALADVLHDASRRGVILLWTVHNKFPHEVKYADLEHDLAQLLIELSTVIIQLNPYTAEAVADAYELPADKLRTIPHSSYQGIYAHSVSREQARAILDVPPSSPTLGFVGQLRLYKGLDTLLAAAELMSRQVEDLTLLLAGKTWPEAAEAIEAALPRSVRLVRYHSYIEDCDLQLWFKAADVMVFPYRRVLNSGSVYLAATFGRPCVLPAEPHLVKQFEGERWVSFYDTDGEPESNLARAAESALETARADGVAAREFATRYTPFDMSRAFLNLLESLQAG